MNLHTLAQGEPWMTPEERNVNHEFIQSIARRLTTQGVPETAFLTLRINDVIATWLLARRLEIALTPQPGEPVPCPTPAQAGAIGKCRDRLRRAMKELEACCQTNATPISADLDALLDRITHQHPTEADTNETQTTESNTPEPPANHGPEEPPPPNRATRRRQAREKHRKKRGVQSMERRRPAGSVAKPPTQPTKNIPRSIQVPRDPNPEQQPGEG